MADDPLKQQKQSASAFWRSYFALFRRRVGDHEVSQTGHASLSTGPAPVLHFPERRKSSPRHNDRLR